MRIAIVGSRDFNDAQLMYDVMSNVIHKFGEQEYIVVSGTARGADRLGEEYAQFVGFDVERYPADWNTYGKGAGHIRNRQMAEISDIIVAFWDGKSTGTKNMIHTSEQLGKHVFVVNYNDLSKSYYIKPKEEKS